MGKYRYWDKENQAIKVKKKDESGTNVQLACPVEPLSYAVELNTYVDLSIS